jgi:hypothetical protein
VRPRSKPDCEHQPGLIDIAVVRRRTDIFTNRLCLAAGLRNDILFVEVVV